jgi:hypothetical protein
MKIRNGFVSNSSSEAFICDSKISLKEAKEILIKMLEFYNEILTGDKRFSIYGYNKVFQEPKFLTKEFFEEVLEPYYDSEYSLKEKISYEEVKDKLIILSVSDNTIPFELFDIIQAKFAAQRIHLG